MHLSILTFGAVERVSRDPIATQFIGSGAILFPARSYYVQSPAKERPLIPGVLAPAGIIAQTVSGLALRRLSLKSVICGYVRVLGAITLGLCVVCVIGVIEGPPSWRDPVFFTCLGVIVAAVGVAVALSYSLGARVTPRDRAIRGACNLVFGVAADLEAVALEDAFRLGNHVELELAKRDATGWRASLEKHEPLDAALVPLVISRVRAACASATGDERQRLEELTDGLITELR